MSEAKVKVIMEALEASGSDVDYDTIMSLLVSAAAMCYAAKDTSLPLKFQEMSTEAMGQVSMAYLRSVFKGLNL